MSFWRQRTTAEPVQQPPYSKINCLRPRVCSNTVPFAPPNSYLGGLKVQASDLLE